MAARTLVAGDFSWKSERFYEIYTKALAMKFVLRKNHPANFSKFPVRPFAEHLPTVAFLCISLEAYLEASTTSAIELFAKIVTC